MVERRAYFNISGVCFHLQPLYVSHLFTVCFVFHQVHLPIAPFPNDPDESVIIHHSSKRVTGLAPVKRNGYIQSRILLWMRRKQICWEKKLPPRSAPATRFWKRRKSAVLDSFFVTRQLVAHCRWWGERGGKQRSVCDTAPPSVWSHNKKQLHRRDVYAFQGTVAQLLT